MGDRIDALKTALDNEKREKEFYLTQARRTQNPLGKAMFNRIAQEEDEHYRMIKEIHEVWTTGGKWPETVPLSVGKTVVPDILKEFLQEPERAGKADKDDLEAIRTAIEFESKGVAFYARLRDQLTDTREKAFFGLLADIEHEHYVSLKETEEYFVDPAAWFRMREKGGLDGA